MNENEIIRDAIKKLEDRQGRLTAEIVLEEARKPTSVLHKCFEWDDTKAAEEWRKEQARKLIRTVRFHVTVEERPIRIPQYIRDPQKDGDEPGYVSLPRIIRKPEGARVLAQEISNVTYLLQRATEIAYVGFPKTAAKLQVVQKELLNIIEEL